MKSITLHGHPGPNPWKVALILEELSIPYDTKIYATHDLKKPPFITNINPNGFAPVVEDPNTGIKSGAIIEYVLESYDKDHLISIPSSSAEARAHLFQWSFFQATFQGPNLSNAFYFVRFPNPEACKRFVDESIRVLGVLDGALKITDGKQKEWLVDDRCTAADLVFVPYMWSMDLILGESKPNLAKDFPNVEAWMQRMSSRSSVKKVKSARDAALAAQAQEAPRTGK